MARAHTRPPGGTGGGWDGTGKSGGHRSSHYSQTARHCTDCGLPMPHAPAWHRLCWKCYRLARVEDHIKRAMRLLHEIAAKDGVR